MSVPLFILTKGWHRRALQVINPFLAKLLALLALSIVYWLLVRTTRSHAIVRNGKQIVAYGTNIKSLVRVSWGALILAIIGFTLVWPIRNAGDRQSALLLAGLIFLLIFFSHLEAFFVQIHFNEEGIETHSPWRFNRFVLWDDLSDITYSPWDKGYKIKTKRHGSIRCHVLLSGLPSLLAELKRRGHEIPSRD